MLWDLGLWVVGEDDSVCALLQSALKLFRDVSTCAERSGHACSAHQRDDLCGLGCQLVRQLLVEVDQIVDVDIAVVLLQQRILSQLISV